MNTINGVNKIAVFFRNGIYNRSSGTYCLNIDGDFIYNMARSELVEQEKSKKTQSLNDEFFKPYLNAEAKISSRAHTYIHHIIENLGKLLGRVPDHVVIFLCAGLSRFRESCRTCFFDIISIHPYMSSTQMYVQRNQNYNLNVFLTHDADILVRAYSHEAFIMDNLDFRIEGGLYSHPSLNADGFSDINVSYNHTDGISVRDSCVWLCPKIMDRLCLISFDSIRVQAGFFPRQFRILAALCGNDYIEGLLSDSMLLGIMNICISDRVIINGLSNIIEIVTAFIYLGIKYNGIPKKPKNPIIFKYSGKEFAYFENSIRNYLRFIDTGVSPRWDINIKFDIANISHSILTAMRGNNTDSDYEWSNKTSLPMAILSAKTTWISENVANPISNFPNIESHIRATKKQTVFNPFFNICQKPVKKPEWKLDCENFPPLSKPVAQKPNNKLKGNENVQIYWPSNTDMENKNIKTTSALTLKLNELDQNVNKIDVESPPVVVEKKPKTTTDEEICSITGRIHSCSIDIPANSTFTKF